MIDQTKNFLITKAYYSRLCYEFASIKFDKQLTEKEIVRIEAFRERDSFLLDDNINLLFPVCYKRIKTMKELLQTQKVWQISCFFISAIVATGIGLLFSSAYGSYGVMILGSIMTLLILVKLISGAKNLYRIMRQCHDLKTMKAINNEEHWECWQQGAYRRGKFSLDYILKNFQDMCKYLIFAKNKIILICTIERYYYSQSIAIKAFMLAGAILVMFSGISLIVASLQSGLCVSAISYAFYIGMGVIITGMVALLVNMRKHKSMSKFKDYFMLAGSDIEEFKKSPMSFALFETYWSLCSAREKFHLWLWELPPQYCTPPPDYAHIFPDEFPPSYDEYGDCSMAINYPSLDLYQEDTLPGATDC
ncbi:hypothetical protein CLAVI_000450 [Candidatus Clavichlamydia salmonicola]|uniref:hypothetical protein n=1 Tax=Candidatus Clavichlamydia salmonicola TaxID=469812 RepID=UPI001891074B|nr:hypothetical protein [Candidatus Clavichlamydia salmonicola]MBF5050831.1 hypothetical protein [Candidatus Clavichlamydia salmonicola]